MPLPTGIHNVLRVTGGSVQSLLLTPGADGMTWEINDPAPIEFCVLTDNPLVERYLTRHVSQVGTERRRICWITPVINLDWQPASPQLAGQNLKMSYRAGMSARSPQLSDAWSKATKSCVDADPRDGLFSSHPSL